MLDSMTDELDSLVGESNELDSAAAMLDSLVGNSQFDDELHHVVL